MTARKQFKVIKILETLDTVNRVKMCCMLKSVEICYLCLLPYTLGIPSRENEPEKEDLNFFSSRNVSLKNNKNIM